LLRQKKSNQRKGDPTLRGRLRRLPCATRQAGRLRNSRLRRSDSPRRLPPARLRCSALHEGNGKPNGAERAARRRMPIHTTVDKYTFVIPAKAGIQDYGHELDSGFRRNDESGGHGVSGENGRGMTKRCAAASARAGLPLPSAASSSAGRNGGSRRGLSEGRSPEFRSRPLRTSSAEHPAQPGDAVGATSFGYFSCQDKKSTPARQARKTWVVQTNKCKNIVI